MTIQIGNGELTRDQVSAWSEDMLRESFSDAHKDLYGYRPRGEYTREDLIDFWLRFDTQISDVIEEENRAQREWLDRESEKYNIYITTPWMWEKLYNAEMNTKFEQEQLEIEAKAAEKAAYERRFSTEAAREDYLDFVDMRLEQIGRKG